MTDKQRDLMIAWLRDAHAMETALEKTLQQQAKHADDDALIRAQIQEHIEVTRRQAQRIDECLKRYGSDSSTTKNLLAKVSGLFQGYSSVTASDTRVKDLLMGIAAEHFEIACYRSLEAAAEELNDVETASVVHQIRLEEQDYLLSLESRLADATVEALREYAVA